MPLRPYLAVSLTRPLSLSPSVCLGFRAGNFGFMEGVGAQKLRGAGMGIRAWELLTSGL